MLPERGGAGYFTLLLADCLADLGRAVTLDELVDAMYEVPGIPWTWVGQRYQAQLVSQGRSDAARRGGGEASSGNGSYDPALGYHHPSFDIHSQEHRRNALRHVVRSRVNDAQRNQRGKGSRDIQTRQWVIRHPDGKLERNPDQHPKVYAEGAYHDWTPEARHAVEQARSAAVAEINRGSVTRRFDRLSLAGKAAVIRALAKQLPAGDKSEAAKVSKSGLLADAVQAVGDDPSAILALIHELTEP